jgi:hypothetical protein
MNTAFNSSGIIAAQARRRRIVQDATGGVVFRCTLHAHGARVRYGPHRAIAVARILDDPRAANTQGQLLMTGAGRARARRHAQQSGSTGCAQSLH